MSSLLETARAAASLAKRRQQASTCSAPSQGLPRPQDVLNMSMSQFAQAGLLISVRPSLFPGELIWLASDNASFEADKMGHYQGRVVYRAREWRQLWGDTRRGMDEPALRLIHEAKKIFGGDLLTEVDADGEDENGQARAAWAEALPDD